MKVAIVLGTRPEILKLYSIIRELEQKQIEHKVYFTSQHFTASMAADFFKEFNIKISDEYPKKFDKYEVLGWLEDKFKEYRPDVVIVQGDTYSAWAGAIAAISQKIKVAHIEAGLRSFDFNEPFPEEHLRTMIDSVSDYLFCSTELAKSNIEDLTKTRKAYVVGNTIIDLVKRADISKEKFNLILITLHRRENWCRVKELCQGIKKLSEKFPEHKIIFVKHANRALASQIEKELAGTKVKFIMPQPYHDFIRIVAMASLVVSDSGGMVEEASYLKTPVAIIREKTERSEAVTTGHAALVGTSKDFYKKVATFSVNYNPIAPCPFGDGKSAQRIVKILTRELQ